MACRVWGFFHRCRRLRTAYSSPLHVIVRDYIVKYKQDSNSSPDWRFLTWKWSSPGVENRPSFWHFIGSV
jgi:hypothetical protein